MFRWVVFASLIVLMLPTDEKQQARLYQSVAAGAHWTATFCDRNAATCKSAGEFWGTFKKKADFAARMVADVVTDRLTRSQAPAATASQGSGQGALQAPSPASGTLSADDLRPVWRANAGRPGA